MKKLHIGILYLFIFALSLSASAKRINVGYFEGGSYPGHDLLRAEYLKQLDCVLPDTFDIVPISEGFRSADWKREDSRRMAAELTHIDHLDMVIAMGPWVVQDLLDAGFKKPILAMMQYDPKLDNLLDDNNRPIASNLIIMWQPERIKRDLTILSRLTDRRKLGFLYFPSDSSSEKLLSVFRPLAEEFGFSVQTISAYDNFGTFAFFKSYDQLKESVDILYISPLWGLSEQEISAFFDKINKDKNPAFLSDGSLILEKGGLATADYYGTVSEARFFAARTKQLLLGDNPAEFDILFQNDFLMAVNKTTADRCGIQIPYEVLLNFYVYEKTSRSNTEPSALKDMLYRAVQYNPGYLTYRERLRASGYATQAQKRSYYPQVTGEAYYRYIDDKAVTNSYEYYKNNQTGIALNIRQSILSLASLQKIKSARLRETIVEINQTEFLQYLEQTVTHAYLDFQLAVALKSALVNYRKIIDYNLQLTKAMTILGDDLSLNISRLETSRYAVNQKIIQAEKRTNNARTALNSLLNLPGESPLELADPLINEKNLLSKESIFLDKFNNEQRKQEFIDKLEKIAISCHPAIECISTEIALSKSILKETKAGYYPTISVSGTLNYADKLQEKISFKEEHLTWEVGGNISFSLWLGGQCSATANQHKANISSLEYTYNQITLEIMKQVRTAADEFIARSFSITPAYKGKGYAYIAVDNATAQYASGDLSVTELLDVLNNAIEADLMYAHAIYGYYTAMADLYYATGNNASQKYTDFLTELHSLINN